MTDEIDVCPPASFHPFFPFFFFLIRSNLKSMWFEMESKWDEDRFSYLVHQIADRVFRYNIGRKIWD